MYAPAGYQHEARAGSELNVRGSQWVWDFLHSTKLTLLHYNTEFLTYCNTVSILF